MEGIGEIRRQNLIALRKLYKTLAALNVALGRNRRDATLGQLIKRSPNSKSGKPREMGTPQAREIESKLQLPRNWMDHVNGAGGLVAGEAAVNGVGQVTNADGTALSKMPSTVQIDGSVESPLQTEEGLEVRERRLAVRGLLSTLDDWLAPMDADCRASVAALLATWITIPAVKAGNAAAIENQLVKPVSNHRVEEAYYPERESMRTPAKQS